MIIIDIWPWIKWNGSRRFMLRITKEHSEEGVDEVSSVFFNATLVAGAKPKISVGMRCKI